jgi:O-antigen ligase
MNPVGQWWGSILVDWGIRYSLFFAIATGLGIVFHRSKLKFKRVFEGQEILLLLFLIIIWLSIPLGLGFTQGESNAFKMTKVLIIIFMATHVITDLKKYEMMVWTLIISGLFLAFEIYNAPGSMFREGRFNVGIGGSDFSDGNFLGAHFAMLLPFIGIMLLKGGWKSKVVCLISGIFVVNSIILCRSRGVFLGILAGLIAAIIFSIPKKRLKIFIGISVAIIGAGYLTDPGYLQRMGNITFESSQLDNSSQGRVLAWEAALKMVSEHPLGIGEGNFRKYVGVYSPTIPGKDTHSTFLRCLAELGVQGLLVYLLLIVNGFRILYKIGNQVKRSKYSMKFIKTPRKPQAFKPGGESRPERNGGSPAKPVSPRETLAFSPGSFIWHVYGIKVSLIIFITCGLTMTHTYIEELYWILAFPIFIERSVKNWSEQNIKYGKDSIRKQ